LFVNHFLLIFIKFLLNIDNKLLKLSYSYIIFILFCRPGRIRHLSNSAEIMNCKFSDDEIMKNKKMIRIGPAELSLKVK